MSKVPAPAPASGLAAPFGAIMGFCRLFLRVSLRFLALLVPD